MVEKGEGKGEMTVREAGHIGGKKGGHKGGEASAGNLPHREEAAEHRTPSKEERERVDRLIGKLKEDESSKR